MSTKKAPRGAFFFVLALPLAWYARPKPITPPAYFVGIPPALSGPQPEAELWIEYPSDTGQETQHEKHRQQQEKMKRR